MDKSLHLTTRLSRADVAGILEALNDGLKEGLLQLHKSGEQLNLEVPRVIDLDLRAEEKDKQAVVHLELSWRIRTSEVPEEPVPAFEPPTAPAAKKKKTSPRKKG